MHTCRSNCVLLYPSKEVFPELAVRDILGLHVAQPDLPLVLHGDHAQEQTDFPSLWQSLLCPVAILCPLFLPRLDGCDNVIEALAARH